MKLISKSVEETNKEAENFISKLIPKNDGATTLCLFGDLGSGKTTFTQAIGRSLGITEIMTSPTFVIEKIYQTNQGEAFGVPKASPWSKLIHIDAYRLDSGKELVALGFAEILKDPKNLILIEWPERVLDILPPDLVKICFKFVGEFEREIEF